MRALYLIPGLVCLFLGTVFLLVFRTSRIRQETEEHSLTAQTWGRLAGTGNRINRNYENRARTVYFGIYEYDTADGQHISSAAGFCYSRPEDIPGTKGNMVKILYNPQKPVEFVLPEEQAVARTVWPIFRKIGIGLTALGVLLTVVAIAAMIGLFDPLFAGLLG